MPYGVIIADDEPLSRRLLGRLVAEDPELQLLGEFGNGLAALKGIEAESPDIVLLDIQMPKLSGLDVAEKIVTRRHPYVVFVTAYNEYAIRAFELHALDYLVKPIEKRRFRECLSRAKDLIRQDKRSSLTDKLIELISTYENERDATADRLTSSIVVKTGDTLQLLNITDIAWLEACNQYTVLHTRSRSFTLSESLGRFLTRHEFVDFYRVHRSAAVNGAFVVDVIKRRYGTHEIHLSTGHAIKMSRGRKNLLPSILKHAHRNTDSL